MMTAGGGTEETMDLNKLLDVINNAETYTKRLSELKDAEKKANDAADKLIQAKNIVEAQERVKITEATAQNTLKNAREEASKLLESAKSEARHQKELSNDELDGLSLDIQSKRRELSELVDRLTVVKQEVLLESSLKQKIMDEAGKIKADSDKLAADIKRRRDLIESL